MFLTADCWKTGEECKLIYLKETKLLRVCTKGTNPTELRTPTSVILHFCRNSWSAEVGVGVFQFKIFE